MRTKDSLTTQKVIQKAKEMKPAMKRSERKMPRTYNYNEVKRLVLKGLSDRKIAKIMGACGGSTISRIRFKLGLPANYPSVAGINTTPEEGLKRMNEYNKKWQADNIEICRKYWREYNKRNIDSKRKNTRIHYYRHRDLLIEQMKRWRIKNKDYIREYYKNNREKIRENQRIYYLKRKQNKINNKGER